MKKLIIIMGISALSVLTFYACRGSVSKSSVIEQKQEMITVYTCEMHPEVIKDKPGNCPICGMKLVEKEIAVSDTMQMVSKADSLN
jgi:Cu(I)/Ag(I) efflux system membrane fusion protein